MLHFERNLAGNWEKGLHNVLEGNNTEKKQSDSKKNPSPQPRSNLAQHTEHRLGREGKLTAEQKALNVPWRLFLMSENNSGIIVGDGSRAGCLLLPDTGQHNTEPYEYDLTKWSD